MKKVALFMPTLGGGGAERVAIGLAKGLAESGCRVWLVVAVARGSLEHEVPRNVTLVDLRAGRVLAAIIPLARWMRVHRPDALITSQGHANIAAFFARQFIRAKGCLVVREESTPSVNLRHLRGLRGWAWRVLLRYVYRRADTVVAVSQGAGDDLRAYLRCSLPNLRVIYNPVITPEMFVLARESVQHQWYGSGENIPIVLAVGRLNVAKNYPLLIRAFQKVTMQRAARLLILGDGEERSALQRLVSELNMTDNVQMPGFDPNPYRYMARSAVYVMSSDWEGLPGSLIQASALCTNVISTDCPSGPREVLRDGELGTLVTVGDVAHLAKAILDHLSGIEGSRVVGGGLPISLNRFTQESVIREYLTILEGERHAAA